MWQDYVFAGGSVIFTIALIPSVFSPNKPSVWTSFLTGIALLVMAITYLTLEFYFSAVAVFANCCLWATLFVQVFSRKNKCNISIPEPRKDSILKTLKVLENTPQLTGEPVVPCYPNKEERDKEELKLTKDTQIIGIAGQPKSGKDVVVDYLVANYKGIRRTVFSDYVIAETNAYLKENNYGHYITVENKSEDLYRELLQDWGIGRFEENPKYWSDKIKEGIQSMKVSGVDLILVTGVRLPADFDMIKEIRGDMWRVHRPGNTYSASHEIEDGWATRPVDYIIENLAEGDLVPFENNILTILSKYQKKI